MVETVFIQLGNILVNISKVRAITPHADPGKIFIYYEGTHDMFNPMVVECSMHDAQRALAETYQQMAMMQAAAHQQAAYGAKGSS